MSIEFKYVPLTFISTNEAIERQLKNTIIFKTVLNYYNDCVQLSDLIISTQYGYTASAKREGTHKLLRITDINNGAVNWDTVPACECERERNYLLSSGDILIARTGNNISYLVDEIVPKNVVFASYLIRIVCDKNKLLPEYLYLFLNSYAFWPQILLKQRGALLQNVNATLMKQLLIPICPIEVQKEIVEGTDSIFGNKIKTEISKTIALFNKKNEISSELINQLHLVKKLRHKLLQEAVKGKLVGQSANDESASLLLQKLKAKKNQLIEEKKLKKEKELPQIRPEEIPFEIPDNWVWCKMGEIAYITSGSTPSQDAFVSHGIPYLKMYNLKNQKIDFDYKPQYIKEEVHNGQLKRCRAYPGDILMNIVGPPLGKIAIIPDHLDQCNFNQAAVLIRPMFKEMNVYIFWYLNEMSEINSIDTKGVAGQANISVTQAHNIKIALPPLNEQRQIVEKLEQLLKTSDALEASIKQSQQQNEQLLQQVLREALTKEVEQEVI